MLTKRKSTTERTGQRSARQDGAIAGHQAASGVMDRRAFLRRSGLAAEIPLQDFSILGAIKQGSAHVKSDVFLIAPPVPRGVSSTEKTSSRPGCAFFNAPSTSFAPCPVHKIKRLPP